MLTITAGTQTANCDFPCICTVQTQESTFPASKTALEAKCGPKSNMTKAHRSRITQGVPLSQGSEEKPEATSVLSLMSDYLACNQDDKVIKQACLHGESLSSTLQMSILYA